MNKMIKKFWLCEECGDIMDGDGDYHIHGFNRVMAEEYIHRDVVMMAMRKYGNYLSNVDNGNIPLTSKAEILEAELKDD